MTSNEVYTKADTAKEIQELRQQARKSSQRKRWENSNKRMAEGLYYRRYYVKKFGLLSQRLRQLETSSLHNERLYVTVPKGYAPIGAQT